VQLGTEIQWLYFEIKRSKVKVTASEVKYGQISTLGSIFTYLQNALSSDYSLLDTRDTDYILKVMSSKVKVTDNFSGGGILIDGVPSETILLL